MPLSDNAYAIETAQLLHRDVIEPLKQMFVGKDEIIDLMAVAMVSRENLFLLGPPGTAKSALVRSLANKIDGRVFDYLLTKFTEPNELFGPFDIRRLRDGELVTNTEGMLPEADFVFLDELLNANSSILNSLLMALNERLFRRGRETRPLPALFFVGASNRLPEDEALNALFDRFLLRVRCDNVQDDQLPAVLSAGWALQKQLSESTPAISVQRLQALQDAINWVDLSPISQVFIDAIRKIRRAGIPISDRRAVKLQRPIAASALICGRSTANTTDLWVLKHIWDIEEQQEILASLVDAFLKQAAAPERLIAHPQSQRNAPPNAEELSQALDRILESITKPMVNEGKQATQALFARDQLSALTTRAQWISDQTQRQFLQEKCNSIWSQLRMAEGE
jgi:MoxR-like ATPase